VLLALLLPGASALAQGEKAAQSNAQEPNVLRVSDYQPAAAKLIRAATATDFAYQRLGELCDSDVG
jgi:hypothetical protein